jgi:hypothetical protein
MLFAIEAVLAILVLLGSGTIATISLTLMALVPRLSG